MITQVFTFGCGQIFAGHYVIIHSPSAERCRELMFTAFGPKWSLQYDEVPPGYSMKILAVIIENDDHSIVTNVMATRIQLT
jgi:hypothetical protein